MLTDCWQMLTFHPSITVTGIVEVMGESWERSSLGLKVVFSAIVPIFFVFFAALNVFTLVVIGHIASSATHNPYRSLSALVSLDLFLFCCLFIRSYYEFLGIQDHLRHYCQSAIGEYAYLVEPVLIGLMGADHLVVLGVTVEQLLLFHYPTIYMKINSFWHTLGFLTACVLVSELISVNLLAFPAGHESATTCPALLGMPDLNTSWVPSDSEAYESLEADLGHLAAGECGRRSPSTHRRTLYYVYSTGLSLFILGASWSLRRTYVERSEASEDEKGVSGVILAEAVISVAQTLTTNLLLAILYPDMWAALFGIRKGRFRKSVLGAVEAVTACFSVFEMVSHCIFLLFLSKKYRETASGILGKCLPKPAQADLDAHTLYTVKEHRILPKKAAENLVIEDVEDVSIHSIPT